jgi:hypothetical protein
VRLSLKGSGWLGLLGFLGLLGLRAERRGYLGFFGFFGFLVLRGQPVAEDDGERGAAVL